MQCNQLVRLIKEWYLHVSEETMAPARMMEFIDKHVKSCDVCREDALLPRDIEKIRAFILPESKIPKAVRSQQNGPTPEISPEVSPDDETAAKQPQPAAAGQDNDAPEGPAGN
ncbi:hypothetical protein MNBD_DELTA04-1062 [hydrothermal vent metagenome]|uniref:Zinc-finger domain-containing protein n=1 Tax=hydrothermal vent metagenome TaxID=652676 RepID=A0A3B0VK43_9ZZZZ